MHFHVTHFWSGDKIEEKIVKYTIIMHFHVTHRLYLSVRQDWRENSQTHNNLVFSLNSERGDKIEEKIVKYTMVISACFCVFDSFSFWSLTSDVSYVKVHVYCVFDYFLFNLVSTSAGELRETACLLCVWLFSLQSCLHLIQPVSYVKLHVYCVRQDWRDL